MRRFTPVPPRKPEGIRWLRSDGKPNISDRIYQVEGDAQIIATRPVYTVARSAPILEAAEIMAQRWVRALPVVNPGTKVLEGMLTAMDLVNYFGGGEYYNIVANRHKDNIFHALRLEPVESIMNPNPIYVTISAKIPEIIEKMVVHNIGVLPVLVPDGRVYGIITEHDIVERLVEKKVGRKVEEVMTRNVVTVNRKATLKEAMETMVKYGVRRLPIVEDESRIWGMITAKDIVRYFGRHQAFENAPSGKMSEAISVPVTLVGVQGAHTISPDADVGDAATKMMNEKVSSLLVVDEEGRLVGIITERDILFAIATAKAPVA